MVGQPGPGSEPRAANRASPCPSRQHRQGFRARLLRTPSLRACRGGPGGHHRGHRTRRDRRNLHPVIHHPRGTGPVHRHRHATHTRRTAVRQHRPARRSPRQPNGTREPTARLETTRNLQASVHRAATNHSTACQPNDSTGDQRSHWFVRADRQCRPVQRTSLRRGNFRGYVEPVAMDPGRLPAARRGRCNRLVASALHALSDRSVRRRPPACARTGTNIRGSTPSYANGLRP